MTQTTADHASRDHEELFASLRELLQREPSEELWQELTALLDQWGDPDVLREVVVPYAQEHLEPWDDSLRRSPSHWQERAIAAREQAAPDNGLFALGRSLFHSKEETKQSTLALINSPRFRGYTRLYLKASLLLPEELERITTSPYTRSLTSLSLPWSGVTDEMLELIAAAPWRLTELALNGNELSDQALATLLSNHSLSHLKQLNISSIRTVGEKTIQAIAAQQLPLESLDLTSCSELTAAELKLLTQSKSFHQLKVLKLRSTSINPYTYNEPKELGALLAQAPQVPPLKHLDLSFSNVTDEDIVALASWRGLEQIEEFELTYHGLQTPGVEALVATPYLRQLKHIDISCAQELTDANFARLLEAPWLQHVELLRLWSCDIDASRARLLSASQQLQRLVELDLWENPLFVGGLRALLPTAAFPQLERLELSECQLGDPGAEYLSQTAWPQQLKELNLERNELTGDGAAAFLSSPHYPELKSLHLCNNRLNGAFDGLPSTCLVPQLEGLYITEAHVEAGDIDALCRILRNGARLKQLDLSGNSSLGPEGFGALLRAPFVEQLEGLTVDNCGIGNQGAELLLEAAPRVSHISFVLYGNKIDDPTLLQRLQERMQLSL